MPNPIVAITATLTARMIGPRLPTTTARSPSGSWKNMSTMSLM